MKRPLAMALLISLFGGSATFGAGGTWTGKISDSYCGQSHKNGPKTGGQILNDAECVEVCIASGVKYVLVTDHGVYAIANQNFKGLQTHIDEKVQLDGDLEGTTITVSKISRIHHKAKN